MISYEKFWKLLDERGLSQKVLTDAGITNRIIDSLRHNRCTRTDTIGRLCDILDCQPGDIMENLPADKVVDKVPAKNKGGRPRKKS